MPNDLIIPLSKSSFLLPSAAGGKASALSELIGIGYRVPKGFVVTIGAIQKLVEDQVGFRDLLEADRLFRQEIDNDISAFSEKVRSYLEQMECPEWFSETLASNLQAFGADTYAVRSSAAVEDGRDQSWAGMFDTFLDVSSDRVFRHICKCCASYFSDRSIAYREHIVPKVSDIEFAVVVQEMAVADSSCVVFSEDPADTSKIRIEAAMGPGPELVSGRVRPDTYLLDRATGILVERGEGGKTADSLPIYVLSQIYDVAMGIESAFGFSVDIELAITDRQVLVLQARRITSMVSNVDTPHPGLLPSIGDYVLTFKVQGLDFLFSDMLANGFGYLNPLLVSIDGDFRQYFPREKMHWAALEGYQWLSDRSGFDEYESSYRNFDAGLREKLSALVRLPLDSQTVVEIFEIFASIMNHYSRMDFQFTNLVWQYAETNQEISANLDKLSRFKDDARTWLNEILLDENGFYAQTVGLLADSLERTTNEIVNLTINEIAKELEDVAITPPSLVANRQSSFAIYVTDGEVHYVDDVELISDRFSQKLSLPGNGRRLFGQIANRTRDEIRGIVRIINVDYANPDRMQAEMDEMNAGEILVAEFTAPELMPACKKALAIVTDLGGMLSHAAIVSREIGVPCLVGTGNAAAVFETGDDVVVDFVASSISHA